MKKRVSNYPEVVPAIGPYSHVCEIGNFVFMSGQIPIDEKGNLVSDDIEQQTRAVFRNIGMILEKNGLSFNDVIKVTVYLTDLGKFAQVNNIYAGYFKSDYPVRTTVGVSQLPKGSLIEIEAVCHRQVD
ncbi:MAG: hypothetical protein HY606_10380 [Planctomycetes bacterium]|nr:hypothetical protein [Planctomycetota bacterium]